MGSANSSAFIQGADDIDSAAQMCPLDRMLVETDSPYLAPVPHRGRANEPQWVVEVAECIAAERGISVDEVAMQTTANFYRLFRGAVPQAPEDVRQTLAEARMIGADGQAV